MRNVPATKEVPNQLAGGDQLVDLADIALVLKTNEAALRKRRSRGQFDVPAVRVGRRLLFRASDVLRFIEQHLETR